jgi:uncharacterized protein DUF3168
LSLPLVREHTDAVIAALDAAGLEVGDAVAPNANPPYVVVYRVFDRRDGTLTRPDDDATITYQVTCVGTSRKQAEWLADEVGQALEAGLIVSGRKIPRIAPEAGSGTVMRDDDVTPPLFYVTPRYRVMSTAG